MKKNELEYRGYTCEVNFSADDLTLYGKLTNVGSDIFLFEIENPEKAKEILSDFVDTLIADGYLE